MLPYDYIKAFAANMQPNMSWNGAQPIADWQAKARGKLFELLGLDYMVRTEPKFEIEYDRNLPESEYGIGVREIRFSFESEPGYRALCHMLLPLEAVNARGSQGQDKLPAVICLQGHSKGMHISLGRTRFAGESVTGDRDFCVRAVREGFAAIALEQRDFGECGGNENGPQCLDEALVNLLCGRTTIGERVWDVMRLYDILSVEFADYVDSDAIYVLGNSGGGTCSVYAGAIDTRLAGAVPSCAVSTFAGSIGAMRHCACNYIPGILKYFDMSDLLILVAPRPLVVVSGRDDDIFPLDGARRMVEAASRAYEALGAPDNIAHVIGEGGHRFYADGAWAALHRMTGR